MWNTVDVYNFIAILLLELFPIVFDVWIIKISHICFSATPQLLLLDVFLGSEYIFKDNNIIIFFAKAEDNVGQ